MLTCEQVRELEAAFALGALDEQEETGIRTHLASCDEHAELGELRAAALALAYSSDEREPSAELRDRVLAAANGGRRGSRWDARRVWLGVAAALVVVLGATLAAIAIGSGGGEDQLYARSFTTDGGIEVDVEADFGRPSATVTFARMATLPEGEEYVVWAIRDGVWLSMGRFRPNENGWWSGNFSFQLQDGDALCVTTGEPIDPYTPHGEPLFIEPL